MDTRQLAKKTPIANRDDNADNVEHRALKSARSRTAAASVPKCGDLSRSRTEVPTRWQPGTPPFTTSPSPAVSATFNIAACQATHGRSPVNARPRPRRAQTPSSSCSPSPHVRPAPPVPPRHLAISTRRQASKSLPHGHAHGGGGGGRAQEESKLPHPKLHSLSIAAV